MTIALGVLFSAAVVSPIASILAVLIPFGWDLATGGLLETFAVVGGGVALVGVGFTTFSPEFAAVHASDLFRWWQMTGAGISCAGVVMVGAA